MKSIKKTFNHIFSSDVFISGTISAVGALIFWLTSGYVFFFVVIHPWWYKFIFIIPFGLVIYILIGIIDHWVFKKLRRTSPKASSSKTKKS